MTETQAQAGWYSVDGGRRYWDGAAWTDQFQTDKSHVDREPDAIWQAVRKPMTGIGAGKYKLTAHYLFFEKGTLRTDSQQVPIAAVLDVDVKQSMAQKARGVGNVVVHIQPNPRRDRDHGGHPELSGGAARDQRCRSFGPAPDPTQSEHHALRGGYASQIPGTAVAQGPVASEPVPAASDPMDQLRKLGKLRDAGILTDEEFSTKRPRSSSAYERCRARLNGYGRPGTAA